MKMKNSLGQFKRKTNNTIRRILRSCVYFILICLILYNILYMFNNVFKSKKYAKIFNIYISTEKENEMAPTIKKNSLIIGVKIKEEDIKEKQIIGYDIDNSIKYHRLIKINNNDNEIIYITKADSNYNIDIEYKQRENIKSRILINIPNLGFLFKIFESKITTSIIIIYLILKFNINKYKFILSNKRKKQRETNNK